MKTKYKGVQFWMFGSEHEPHDKLCDKYLRSPTIKQKNSFYNQVDIWMAPTMSEGLHLPPAEAMMTECPVVGTNAELSGTEDYLLNGYSGLVADNNFQSFSTNVEKLMNNETLRLKMGKSARKMIFSLGDRKANMIRLLNYFMGIIT